MAFRPCGILACDFVLVDAPLLELKDILTATETINIVPRHAAKMKGKAQEVVEGTYEGAKLCLIFIIAIKSSRVIFW